MKTYAAVIERCPETGLLVGYIPGWPGAHSQGAAVEELNRNLGATPTVLFALKLD